MSTTTHTKDDRRKKRGAIVKFGLAGVALLGIGAAATSAAWSDDAWFTANATSVTVELQASINGTTWVDADTSGAAVTIPAAAFQNLNENQTRNVTVYLRNNGNVPLTVAAVPAETATTGAIFGGANPATVTVGAPVLTTLAASDGNPGGPDETTAVVTVTTPSGWPTSYQNQTGTLTVAYRGQS